MNRYVSSRPQVFHLKDSFKILSEQSKQNRNFAINYDTDYDIGNYFYGQGQGHPMKNELLIFLNKSKMSAAFRVISEQRVLVQIR